MDTPGIVRRVVTKPRDVIPRTSLMNPDVRRIRLSLFTNRSLSVLDVARRARVQFSLRRCGHDASGDRRYESSQ